MEVVFQKLSCLGNDIHSLLWKLGSLYLFILATNLFQVNCGFITHLLLSIILMKKVILIIFLVCSEALSLNLRDAAWVSLELSVLSFPFNKKKKYTWRYILKMYITFWDFNMWMWRSGFHPSSISFNFRDKSCFSICWLLDFKWSWDYHGIKFTFLLLVYKPFLKNQKGLINMWTRWGTFHVGSKDLSNDCVRGTSDLHDTFICGHWVATLGNCRNLDSWLSPIKFCFIR